MTKTKMPNLQQKMASNQKKSRKQTSLKIQFYIGIYVTRCFLLTLVSSLLCSGDRASVVGLMDKQQAGEAAGARPLFTDGRCYVVRSKWRLLIRKMV